MNTISRCKPLLGTYVELTLCADESRDVLIDMSISAFSKIEKIESLMSFHNVKSELSYINRFAHIKACCISKDTEAVLNKALQISKKTDGLFDVTIAPSLVRQGILPNNKWSFADSASWKDIYIENREVSFYKPMLIDLGGIAKGYAVDLAMSIFDDKVNVIINAGGDLKMSHWMGQYVQVKYISPKVKKIIKIPMIAPAVATSANYYLDGKSAIISPKTGKTILVKNSYSVFAENCILADALTKVAFLSAQKNNLINSFGAKLVSINQKGIISTT